MSQQNVELVRRTFAAFDAGGFEAMLPFFPDDVIWYTAPGWLEDPAYRGHDGARRLTALWTDNFNDFTMSAREMRDFGDRVLVLVEATGRTKEGDIPIRQLSAMLYSGFRDDKIAEVRFFLTWEEGFTAARAPASIPATGASAEGP